MTYHTTALPSAAGIKDFSTSPEAAEIMTSVKSQPSDPFHKMNATQMQKPIKRKATVRSVAKGAAKLPSLNGLFSPKVFYNRDCVNLGEHACKSGSCKGSLERFESHTHLMHNKVIKS